MSNQTTLSHRTLELRLDKDIVSDANVLLAAAQRGTTCGYHYDTNTSQHVLQFENVFKVFLFGLRYRDMQAAALMSNVPEPPKQEGGE